MGGFSRLSWQDLYYDGHIDERNEFFCEDSQKIIERRLNDNWDEVHTWNNGNGYIDALGILHEKEYGTESDDWYIKMLNGEIKRFAEK